MPVDVLIITALAGELEALRDVEEGRESEWVKDKASRDYWVASFATESGEITVAAAFADHMAGVATAIAATELIGDLGPQALAMCGVCAGHPEDTIIGDVVLADRVFQHDEGKKTPDGFVGDQRAREPPAKWHRVALEFPQPDESWYGYGGADAEYGRWWFLSQLLAGRNVMKSSGMSRFLEGNLRPRVLTALRDEGFIVLGGESPELTEEGKRAVREHLHLYGSYVESAPYKVHVAPIASGNYVVGDSVIWEELPSQKAQRKAIGVEMEAAAIGGVAKSKGLPFAVAKAVMDHADPLKADGAKSFAARVSAEVLTRFLRMVVEPRKQQKSEEQQDDPRRHDSSKKESNKGGGEDTTESSNESPTEVLTGLLHGDAKLRARVAKHLGEPQDAETVAKRILEHEDLWRVTWIFNEIMVELAKRPGSYSVAKVIMSLYRRRTVALGEQSVVPLNEDGVYVLPIASSAYAEPTMAAASDRRVIEYWPLSESDDELVARYGVESVRVLESGFFKEEKTAGMAAELLDRDPERLLARARGEIEEALETPCDSTKSLEKQLQHLASKLRYHSGTEEHEQSHFFTAVKGADDPSVAEFARRIRAKIPRLRVISCERKEGSQKESDFLTVLKGLYKAYESIQDPNHD